VPGFGCWLLRGPAQPVPVRGVDLMTDDSTPDPAPDPAADPLDDALDDALADALEGQLDPWDQLFDGDHGDSVEALIAGLTR
jgi:hypothetical protein